MKTFLLGTSQIENITNAGLSKRELDDLLEETADLLAKYIDEVYVVPQKGVFFDLALRYQERGGKVIGMVPSGDEKYGIDHLKPNLNKIDERIDLKDWYNFNGEIAAKGDVSIVIGYSAGVFSDLSFLKYHKQYFDDKTKVIIFENTVSQKLPTEFEEDIKDVHYIKSTNELRELLEKYK